MNKIESLYWELEHHSPGGYIAILAIFGFVGLLIYLTMQKGYGLGVAGDADQAAGQQVAFGLIVVFTLVAIIGRMHWGMNISYVFAAIAAALLCLVCCLGKR